LTIRELHKRSNNSSDDSNQQSQQQPQRKRASQREAAGPAAASGAQLNPIVLQPACSSARALTPRASLVVPSSSCIRSMRC
jgi:hypothetical protein